MSGSRYRAIASWLGFVLFPAALIGVVVGVAIPNHKRAFVENEMKPPAPPPEICITRYFSDVDGREISDPLVQHYDGERLREYRGTVIVRYLDGDKWLVQVIFRGLVIQEDGSGREEVVDRVEWEVKEKVEFQVYFDPTGKAEMVGAIRS